MIELGKKQKLEALRKATPGMYLGDEVEQVLLPTKQIPEDLNVGDSIEVFIYRDSSDRLISTVREPLIKLGEIAELEVKEVGKIGAFLDWGLEKDLLLPYKEQTTHLNEGDKVLVIMYIDKSSRLCASMKLYHHLKTDSQYKKDDAVEGYVYEIIETFGAYVAVDDKYQGLINTKEMGTVKVGQRIIARVTDVKEDGKLNLSIRKKAHIQMHEDAELIIKVIEEYAGILPYTDKASPEVIKNDFNLSKAAFKRAVGGLLKAGIIEITETSIRLK